MIKEKKNNSISRHTHTLVYMYTLFFSFEIRSMDPLFHLATHAVSVVPSPKSRFIMRLIKTESGGCFRQ